METEQVIQIQNLKIRTSGSTNGLYHHVRCYEISSREIAAVYVAIQTRRLAIA